MVAIGIIGIGRWGINYFRTFNEMKEVSVKWICATKNDTIREAISIINPIYSVKTTLDYRDVLRDKEIEAVIITTPGTTHYRIASASLSANKHVLVEKPLCLKSAEIRELISISEQRKKILMVGYIHLYNPPIRKLREDIIAGVFGKIHYIQSCGTGNGPVRQDMSALWDILSHDVSILFYLLEQTPLKVSAVGKSYLKDKIVDMVTMNLFFPENVFATAFASWLYPLKKREVIVVGEKLYAVFDDYTMTEKLKYYDSRLQVYSKNPSVGYYSPPLKDAKPLTEQVKHFLYCIKNNKLALTNGYEALKINSVLESAEQSLKNEELSVLNKNI